ncbi:hypothetical protein FD754_005807, partial [Muntiacus muntjak]
FMPKHKAAHLRKILSLTENGGTAPSTALPFQQELRGSENLLKSFDSKSGPCDAAQQESLGCSVRQESYLKTFNSSDDSSTHHGEHKQNQCGILAEADDQQRPLHIVWPHRCIKIGFHVFYIFCYHNTISPHLIFIMRKLVYKSRLARICIKIKSDIFSKIHSGFKSVLKCLCMRTGP